MKELLEEVKKYANALAEASKWNGSGESIASVEAKRTKTGESDYIYEFFCYIAILSDLKTNYALKFIEGEGKNRYAFPKAPARKDGRPFFIALNKTTKKEEFQICAGTQVKSRFKKPAFRSPDISFQEAGTGKEPGYLDLYMIFDAKYNRPESLKSAADANQYSYVTQMIVDLDLNLKRKIPIKFNHFSELIGNCLITNGRASNSDKERNIANFIKEVENFTAPLDYRKIKVIG